VLTYFGILLFIADGNPIIFHGMSGLPHFNASLKCYQIVFDLFAFNRFVIIPLMSIITDDLRHK
jgi:hypothetical protein